MHFLICALLGATSVLAMSPWGIFPALMLGLCGLYYCVSQSSSMLSAFAKGWVFAFSYFFFGLIWVGNALLVEGNEYVWAWPLAICGLPFVLAFFSAFACGFSWEFSNLRTFGGYLAFAGYLALFEWARGHAFTGFPWNLYGHAWNKLLPILQVLALTGSYGLTYLTILWLSLPAFLYISDLPRFKKQIVTLFVLASFIFCYSYGYARIDSASLVPNSKSSVRLVQANIPQADKWDREKMWSNFLRHIALSRPDAAVDKKGITYIVWPETSLNQWILEEPRAMYLIRSTLRLYQKPAYLMTGYLRKDEQGRYYNSFVTIDIDGKITNMYNKAHLVPFGEYIPFQKLIPLEPVAKFRGFSGENAGTTFTTPNGLRFSPAICYEIIFPETFYNHHNKSDVIINVTNDSWYGDSSGPWQHLNQAVYRSIEQGLPVIRAADTGISAVIDPYGRIVTQSNLEEVFATTVSIPMRSESVPVPDFFKNLLLFIALGVSAAFGYLERRFGQR